MTTRDAHVAIAAAEYRQRVCRDQVVAELRARLLRLKLYVGDTVVTSLDATLYR